MAVLAWLLITTIVAASGVLRRLDATPPPFALLALAVGVVGIAVPCSSLGTLLVCGLPLWALVGFQVFRWFGNERLNTFVTYPPFVWLPAVLVVGALMGHILVWRRLSAKRAA